MTWRSERLYWRALKLPYQSDLFYFREVVLDPERRRYLDLVRKLTGQERSEARSAIPVTMNPATGWIIE